MKESWGDRDQVINKANGAQWKLCKPKGTNCRMLQCATPAECTGTEVRKLTLYFYSILRHSILCSQAPMMNAYLTSPVFLADSEHFLSFEICEPVQVTTKYSGQIEDDI